MLFEETPKFPNWASKLSTLGGAISIYMGLSFIMIFEVLEAALDIGLLLLSKKRGT